MVVGEWDGRREIRRVRPYREKVNREELDSGDDIDDTYTLIGIVYRSKVCAEQQSLSVTFPKHHECGGRGVARTLIVPCEGIVSVYPPAGDRRIVLGVGPGGEESRRHLRLRADLKFGNRH